MLYLVLKLVHIIGVIMFMGNITIGPFWKMHAERTKDPKKIANTFDGIIRADRLFTMPGVGIILIFGIGAAVEAGFNIINTPWIFWSLILIIISGTVFMAKVVPIQKKILALASDENQFNWDKYKTLARQWDIWGTVATLAPYVALVLMVIKPA